MLAVTGSFSIPFDVPPYRLSGTVYGALLNHRSALAALADTVNQPPYNAPPHAPVLFIKPRNTLVPSGRVVRIPARTGELEVGASVGLVLGRTACKISEAQALDYVAGYLIVADVSIPQSSYHRPNIRLNARDGFCPLGAVTARAAAATPEAMTIRTYIDEGLVQTARTADLIRPAAKLLAEVTDFMTLSPGDVLSLGAAGPAPHVRSGQTIRIAVEGLESLRIPFEGAA